MFTRSTLIATVLLTTLACGEDDGTSGNGAGGSSGESGSSGTSTGGDAQGGQSGGGTGGDPVGGTGGANAGGESNGGGGNSGEGGAGGSGPMKQFTCPSGPFPAPEVGTAETLCQDFPFNQNFNEGPTWIASQGAFFFSNFVQGAPGGNLNGDIIKYTPGSSCELFITGTGTNGLGVAADGNIIGASHKTRSITEYNIETKEATILTDSYMGMMLDSPNDLVAHSKGSIYFTNPIYELGGRAPGVGPGVFWLDPNGVLTRIAEVVNQPNGIALSPDETKLYVVNGGVWDIDANGVPSNRQPNFPDADGMAVDCAGNIYLSGGAILDSNLQTVGNFPGGTNLAFGGEDGKTLFVVNGGTGVYTVRTNIPGLP